MELRGIGSAPERHAGRQAVRADVRNQAGSRLAAALVLAGALVVAVLAPSAASAVEPREVKVTKQILKSAVAEGTPASVNIVGVGNVNLNRVGIIKVAPKGESAKNVLVMEPGTSSAAAYFLPLARSLVEATTGWQVWAVERRENFLENQKMLDKYKSGKLVAKENPLTKKVESPAEQLFNYYLGYLGGASVKAPYKPVLKSEVEFAKKWGMSVAVEDLKVVVEHAKKLHGKVVLGGHSLGGWVVTAYATWDFGGKPGAEGLSGLILDDGGSSPVPVSKEEAETSLSTLDESAQSPWLVFGGIAAPDLGLFSALGSTLAVVAPKEPSALEHFPLLPPDLKSPISPVTNEAAFGYAVNVGTSPASLLSVQIHGGKGVEETAELDGLHGWNGEGRLTPLRRYSEMLSGTGFNNASGAEWYFPARLTLDSGAVGNGIGNPAQELLGLHSTMGANLPKSLHILAINSELDKVLAFGRGTLADAEALAEQSGIPNENLTLINVENTYSHNDINGALPAENEFVKHLVPFLTQIAP